MGATLHGLVQVRHHVDSLYDTVASIDSSDLSHPLFAMFYDYEDEYKLMIDGVAMPLSPISEMRGLPDDFIGTPKWKEHIHDVLGDLIDNPMFAPSTIEDFQTNQLEQFDIGEYWQTWVTLREIFEWYGWNHDLEMVSTVTREEFKRLRTDGGSPVESHYSAGLNDVIVDESDVTKVDRYTHVFYRWSKPYIEVAWVFRKLLEYLEAKYSWELKRDPDAVRLVFGYS